MPRSAGKASPAQGGLEAEEPEGEIDIQEATEDELAESEEPEERRAPAPRPADGGSEERFVDLGGSMIFEESPPRDHAHAHRPGEDPKEQDEQKEFQ